MIKISNLHKFFNKRKQNEVHVINDISLSLPEKGLIAIFGKSGCGKTTLLNTIGGLDNYDSGSITIDGKTISSNTDYIRNRYIGYIFQNYNLCKGRTVYQNISDVLHLCGETNEEIIKERVSHALHSVGMDNYSNRLPDTLSGGQQQRIAIARAIVKSPAIILADEPTGNLDEANTIKIMDILKKISQNCLVLLVSHEEKNVYEYCDKIISLSDGHVIDIIDNNPSQERAKNTGNNIYLGDFDKKSLNENGARLDFYGDALANPIEITVINKNGRVYLQINGDDISLIDEKSEIKILNGKSKDIEIEKTEDEYTPLPSLSLKSKNHYGNLFTIKDGITTGFKNIVDNKKKSLKLLRRCLSFFGAAIVVFASVYGSKILKLNEIKNEVLDDIFYIQLNGEESNEKLKTMKSNQKSGIDWYSFEGAFYSLGESSRINIKANYFTSVTSSISIESNALLLPFSLCDSDLICGSKSLDENAIWISKAVADDLIKSSNVGYVSKYDDLLNNTTTDGLKITAITKDEYMMAFVSEMYLAKNRNEYLSLGVDSSLNDNEAVYYCSLGKKPEKGSNIHIFGVDVVITDVKIAYSSYFEWLKDYNSEIYEDCESLINYNDSTCNAFYDKVEKEDGFAEKYIPGYVKGAEINKLSVLFYLFSEFDSWVKYNDDAGMIPNDYYGKYNCGELPVWVYDNKLDDFAKYLVFSSYDESYLMYFIAMNQYAKTGTLPEEWDPYGSDYSLDFYLYNLQYRFGTVYSKSGYVIDKKSSGNLYVSKNKYIEISNSVGTACDEIIGYSRRYYDNVYAIVHSTNPQMTEEFLLSEYGDQNNCDYLGDCKFLSPSILLEYKINEEGEAIVGGIIAFLIVLCLLCVCVFFIMRSNFLSRIKEIGIYRAIGVSKKNLRREFFIETMVLVLRTVCVGWLILSAILMFILRKTVILSTLIFYPLWFALAVLAFIFIVCSFAGLIPINMLLRNTPAQIIAKYDI